VKRAKIRLSPMPMGVRWCAVGALLQIERFEKKY